MESQLIILENKSSDMFGGNNAYRYADIGGGSTEITLRENHTACERIRLKPRVLRDINKRDLTTTILGQTVAMPILAAPTAFHCPAHPEGEVATARAAGKTGTIMMLSTLSTRSIEDVMSEATGLVWF